MFDDVLNVSVPGLDVGVTKLIEGHDDTVLLLGQVEHEQVVIGADVSTAGEPTRLETAINLSSLSLKTVLDEHLKAIINIFFSLKCSDRAGIPDTLCIETLGGCADPLTCS